MIGIVYDGITALPKESLPPKDLLLQWYATVIQIEKQNQLLNERLKELVTLYRSKGIEPILLKGQGVAQYYNQPLHRQSGDIDFYLPEKYDEANHLISSLGYKLAKENQQHTSFEWKGISVENHFKPFFFYSSSNDKKAQKYKERLGQKPYDILIIDNITIFLPSPQTNIVYLFLHIFHHFITGIGLRQICDWVCLLNAKKYALDKLQLLRDINNLPINRSIRAFAYICVNYLGTDANIFPFDIISRKTQKDGEIILEDIFRNGNFAHETIEWNKYCEDTLNGKIIWWLHSLIRCLFIFRFCPSEAIAHPFASLRFKLKNLVIKKSFKA